ncbi:hypothetical protein [Streptomyces sp. NPDC006446]|uniref:hypothetical protein n=1 Tax=Streptomyces sp. NPDC006446 TaxID=3154301 RepID=UPI0033B28499
MLRARAGRRPGTAHGPPAAAAPPNGAVREGSVVQVDAVVPLFRRAGAVPVHHTPKPPADLTLVLAEPQLLGLPAGGGLEGIESGGDTPLPARLVSYVREPDTGFPVVTP